MLSHDEKEILKLIKRKKEMIKFQSLSEEEKNKFFLAALRGDLTEKEEKKEGM